MFVEWLTHTTSPSEGIPSEQMAGITEFVKISYDYRPKQQQQQNYL